MRSLELVQDRLADGDHASQPMQRKLLEMIDARFATKEGSRFENELNRRALLVYAMSGGNPATVEAALAHLGKDDPNRKLGESILFYINGKPKEAMEALSSVDPMAYTPDIAMYLALVKGSILSEAEPQNALALLDRARLLAPARWSRRPRSAARSPSPPSSVMQSVLLRLSEQYVRGYLRSPYASQFADAFVAGVVTLSATIDRQAVADCRRHDGARAGESDLSAHRAPRCDRRADRLRRLRRVTCGRGGERSARRTLLQPVESVTSGTIKDVLDKLVEDRPQPAVRERPAASRRGKRHRRRNDRASGRSEARRG